jgi:flagellar motor switch protein FliM
MDMRIKPFHFKLKKASAVGSELLASVYDFFPSAGIGKAAVKSIVGAVRKLVGKDVELSLEAVHEEAFSDFRSKLQGPSQIALFGMSPVSRRGIVEIDSVLSVMLVERMLGSDSKSIPDPRPLGDTEQGVLEYLLLRIMAAIFDASNENPKVHFRFDRFADGPKWSEGLYAPGDRVMTFAFRVKVGRANGFVHICLPHPFAEEAMLGAVDRSELLSDEEIAGEMRRFEYVNMPMWAEAGRTMLTQGELMGIEPGDIVVLDESTIEVVNGKPSGDVVLRVGLGQGAGIDASLEVERRKARCTIKGIHKGDLR